jgi:hypothetical protein
MPFLAAPPGAVPVAQVLTTSAPATEDRGVLLLHHPLLGLLLPMPAVVEEQQAISPAQPEGLLIPLLAPGLIKEMKALAHLLQEVVVAAVGHLPMSKRAATAVRASSSSATRWRRQHDYRDLRPSRRLDVRRRSCVDVRRALL